MGIESIKERAKQVKYWEERNDLRIEIEHNIRLEIQKRLKYYITYAKKQFKEYFITNEFTIKEDSKSIIAQIHTVSVGLYFDTPNPGKTFSFGLVIIKDSRKEKRILVHCPDSIYYPNLALIRKMPESIDQIKEDIDRMDNEILNLQESFSKIPALIFVFSYHDEKVSPKPENMMHFSNIKEIISRLLE